MSVTALAVVKARKTGSATRKAILLVLADYADEAWSCWPSQERIAWETELGERTVRRTLTELEADGLIRRVARRGAGGHRTSDRTVLVETAIRALPARAAGRAHQPATVAGCQPATDDSQPATDDNPNRPQWPGNRHREPSEEPSEAFALASLAAPRPTSKGTRIPDDLTITPPMAAWAAEKVPGLNIDTETEKFCDYWRSKSGSKAVHSDWTAAWRNWMRRAHEDNTRHTTQPSKQQRALDIIRRVAVEQ